MKKSKFSKVQIATALRQVEAGAPIPSHAGARDQRSDVRCLAQAIWPDGDRRGPAAAAAGGGEPQLKQLVADLTLDKVILQEVLAKKTLKPARKRALVREVLGRYPIGVRRACGLVTLNRA